MSPFFPPYHLTLDNCHLSYDMLKKSLPRTPCFHFCLFSVHFLQYSFLKMCVRSCLYPHCSMNKIQTLCCGPVRSLSALSLTVFPFPHYILATLPTFTFVNIVAHSPLRTFAFAFFGLEMFFLWLFAWLTPSHS